MTRLLPGLVAMCVLAASGLVHGLWTERWRQSEDLERAAERVARMPLRVGGWEGRDIADPEPEATRQAGIVASRLCAFKDPRTAQELTVLLVCGRAGRIAAHTPEVCFPGSGLEMAGAPVRQSVAAGDGPPAEFWAARFRTVGDGAPTTVRALWAWSATGAWQAPDNPRLTYAGGRALYKLYVVRTLNAPDEPLESEPGLDLLRHLLPELRRALFATP